MSEGRHKTCEDCGDTIYGSYEREADGYRTWWDTHWCSKPKPKVKKKVRYNWELKTWSKIK